MRLESIAYSTSTGCGSKVTLVYVTHPHICPDVRTVGVHGICLDRFNIVGIMFTNKECYVGIYSIVRMFSPNTKGQLWPETLLFFGHFSLLWLIDGGSVE